MKVTLLRVTDDPERLVEIAAATCTKKDPYTKLKSGGMDAVESGHDSVLEHVTFTFLIEGCSRAFLAQLTRHRLASYSVLSQRYVSMHEMEYVTPRTIQELPVVSKRYHRLMREMQDFYDFATSCGVPGEDARFATPQAACTNILVSMNARELKHVLSLRECNKAQWEIRVFAERALALAKGWMPKVFENAGAPCRSGQCPEKRPCGKPKKKVTI